VLNLEKDSMGRITLKSIGIVGDIALPVGLFKSIISKADDMSKALKRLGKMKYNGVYQGLFFTLRHSQQSRLTNPLFLSILTLISMDYANRAFLSSPVEGLENNQQNTP
jgi:hypothetical protein